MTWKKTDELTKYGILLTPDTKKIPLGSTNLDYEIYKIPLELLKYNSSNGRIFMEMAKLKSLGDVDIKALEEDNVEQFNDEIESLIWESSPEKNEITLEDIKKYTQLESGVVLDDGTVIDGNRRFTCLRRLHALYPENDDFKYLKAAIIFRDGSAITQKDIKRYELKVQYGQDEKVAYKAVNFAMSLYQEIKNGTFTIQEMAENVNKKPGDITKIVQTCELVEDFLEYLGRPGQLYVAEELNIYWPLEPLAAYLNGQDGAKLSETDKLKRKHLFYDYLITIDTTLPTQEFRDNLIKKIFKDEILWKELSNEYESHEGEKVQDELVQSDETPEEFVKHVKEFKKNSDISKKIHRSYRNKVEKKNMQKLENAPIVLCGEIIERLRDLNIDPFLSATSALADDKLRTIHKSLKEASDRIADIQKKIESKITFDD